MKKPNLKDPVLRPLWFRLVKAAWNAMPDTNGWGGHPEHDALSRHLFYNGIQISRNTLRNWIPKFRKRSPVS